MSVVAADVQLLQWAFAATVPSVFDPVRMSCTSGLLGTWLPRSSSAMVVLAIGHVASSAAVPPSGAIWSCSAVRLFAITTPAAFRQGPAPMRSRAFTVVVLRYACQVLAPSAVE